jgi:hypothetical protein
MEDRIRELCRRALTASDDELAMIAQELTMAVNEHARRVDNNLLATILKWPDPPRERRKP